MTDDDRNKLRDLSAIMAEKYRKQSKYLKSIMAGQPILAEDAVVEAVNNELILAGLDHLIVVNK